MYAQNGSMPREQSIRAQTPDLGYYAQCEFHTHLFERIYFSGISANVGHALHVVCLIEGGHSGY